MQTRQTSTNPANPMQEEGTPRPSEVRDAIAKRSFGMLATTSQRGRPHAAGVLFELIGDDLWVNTLRLSRKARNVAENPSVALSVPVRRLPVGPPSSIQFQAAAEIVALEDPAVQALVAEGKLQSLTSHGELDLPGGCFLRIGLPRRILTYGLGMSLRKLLADPLGAGRVVTLDPAR